MDFSTLIYHPVAEMSYLLKYLWNDVKPLEYKTIQAYNHWLDKLYEKQVFDKDIEDDNHQFGILKKGLVGIEEYHKWLVDNPLKGNIGDFGIYRLIRTEDLFFNVYIDWLNETMPPKLSPYAIGPQKQMNNQWYRFIKWLEEAIHGDHVHQFPTLDKRKYK